MLNPLAFATEQQRQQLAQMQVLSQNIQYTVHTEDSKVEITLKTDDPQAEELIPQIIEGMVESITQMLYQMFAMKGERV